MGSRTVAPAEVEHGGKLVGLGNGCFGLHQLKLEPMAVVDVPVVAEQLEAEAVRAIGVSGDQVDALV